MNNITPLFPVAREVPCGGRNVKVSEFRLRDLAFLQGVLDGLEPDPYGSIEAELATASPARKRELLLDAWDRAEIGPPTYGTERARSFFSTTAGAALILWVAVRRDHPELTPGDAAELYVAATAQEVGLIWRIAHGIPTWKALEKHVFMPIDPAPQSQAGATWNESIDELSRERGWDYNTIFDMTITQWMVARNGGRLPEPGRQLQPGESAKAAIEWQNKWLAGEFD